MVSHPSMGILVSRMCLCTAAMAMLVLGGCSGSQGDRCQVNSDCGSGLTCQGELSSGNGTCQPAGSTGLADAATDAATATEPETESGIDSSIDAQGASQGSLDVAEDTATVALDATSVATVIDGASVDTGAID